MILQPGQYKRCKGNKSNPNYQPKRKNRKQDRLVIDGKTHIIRNLDDLVALLGRMAA